MARAGSEAEELDESTALATDDDGSDPRVCARCGARRGSDRPFVEPHLCLACVPTVSELLDLADAAESAAGSAKGETATATLTAAGFQLRGLAAILSRHKQG